MERSLLLNDEELSNIRLMLATEKEEDCKLATGIINGMDIEQKNQILNALNFDEFLSYVYYDRELSK